MASTIVEQPAQAGEDTRREEAWRLRRGMWRLADQVRHQTCGRAARADGVRVDVATFEDGSRHASASGLITCSSIWCCPVCSANIRAERRNDLQEAVEEWRHGGGGLVFVTLTMQHLKRDQLVTLLDALMKSWAAVQQSRAWRRPGGPRSAPGVVARLELAGWVRALEITYGKRGWHPHLHLLLFTGRPITENERDDLQGLIEAEWIGQLERQGRSAKAGVAVDVRRVTDDPSSYERIAGYATKTESISWEVARSDFKSGRRSSITTTQLLDAAVDGESWAVGAWREYERATSGRRAIEWSRGLRALVGLAEERSDEEITDDTLADASDAVSVDLVAILTPYEWRCVAWAGWDYRLLRACEGRDPAGWHYLDVIREAVQLRNRGPG